MKKITWKKAKGGRVFEHITEGFVDGEIAFRIEGRLCLTDMRAMKASHKTDTFVPSKSYRLGEDDPKKEAKNIAYDLLNGLNTEIHEANFQKEEDKARQTAKTLKEAQEFLDSLKNK